MTEIEPARTPLVLIANDQEWSARSLESMLAPNGFEVIRAFTAQQALDRVRENRPDIVVLDAQMPDMHGFDVCRTLRDERLVSPGTPVIITTAGPAGRAQRIDAFAAGAWDFFGQPLDGDMLLLKLRTYLAAKFETDRARADALLDAVSGLYSRAGLTRRAREIGADASRRHEPIACVVFGASAEAGAEPDGQLDGLVGPLLRRASRLSDAVGRLATGEYAVVAPATGAAGAARLATRIGGALESATLEGGGIIRLRVRAGYCAVPDFARSTLDVPELLLRAASALHDLEREGDSERVRSVESPSVNFSS